MALGLVYILLEIIVNSQTNGIRLTTLACILGFTDGVT